MNGPSRGLASHLGLLSRPYQEVKLRLKMKIFVLFSISNENIFFLLMNTLHLLYGVWAHGIDMLSKNLVFVYPGPRGFLALEGANER